MVLLKIGYFGIIDNEMCSMNFFGCKIMCENCKVIVMNELEFILFKYFGDIFLVFREYVYMFRIVYRYCCVKLFKLILYYYCLSEMFGKLLFVYIF